jgi:carboxyl-terminal processing protease
LGLTWFLLAAALLCLPGARAIGQSQVPSSPEAVSSFAPFDLSALLEKGRELEDAQRWVEALSYYEEALREHPDATDLKQRYTLSHIHCDLGQRHDDSSYRQLLAAFDQQQALEMFNEIALKIQTHFVHEPDWRKITWRGTANMDVALTETTFCRQNLPQATQEKINAYRHFLRNDVNQRLVRDRAEARNLVGYAARSAARDLGVAPQVVILEYCCGAIAALDQFSTYLTAGQLDEVYDQIEGNFIGLGIELRSEEDGLLIVKVIPGGPAQRAGIRAGDRITAVDGQDTRFASTEKAADLLKGDPDTSVVVTLLGPDGQLRTARVRRERVDVPSVEEIKIVDPDYGIGYFRLSSFQKTSSRDVDRALWELHRQGMKSLILDLRSNPGGLLTASVEIADKFVSDGTIVATKGRSPRENFVYQAHRAGTWQMPLVVLIDRDTASASEILAGAIRDHRRGLVVGERSYGKGSVQGIFPLTVSRSGIRLTTAKFYTPSGQPISERGVEPHTVVRSAARPITADGEVDLVAASTDVVLDAGLQVARRLAATQQ